MLGALWGAGRFQPYCSRRDPSMDQRSSRRSRSVRPPLGLSRRGALFAGLSSFAGIGFARADDRALDALMGDVDRGGFGQGFDQGSRTVHMPKATIPML